MGVRLSQPEPQPTAAQVHRWFPEQTLTAEPIDTVRTGHDKRIDDNEAYPRLTMPLLRSWSARLAEAQEVLVRFQRVAPRSPSHATSLRHASVAPRQSSRFLPGSVLVRVQPEARLRVRPTGEVPASRAEPGEFDSHDPLHAHVVFFQRQRIPVSHSGKHGFDSRTRHAND